MGESSSGRLRWADLGPVELQLVVRDPPGLLGLQPLRRLLLHVVLPQLVRLDHLLEDGHAGGASGKPVSRAQGNAFRINHYEAALRSQLRYSGCWVCLGLSNVSGCHSFC